MYDRELGRRKDLDSAIGLPISFLTLLVAANFYLFSIVKSGLRCFPLTIFLIFNLFIILSFLISAIFLTKSYNNFFKGYKYSNLSYLKEIRRYEKNDLENYNKQVDEEKRIDFTNVIIDKLSEITDENIIINDLRAEDLYKSRTFIIVSFVLTTIKLVLLVFLNS